MSEDARAAAAAIKNSARHTGRQQAHQPVHKPVHKPAHGGVEVEHNGEILSRSRRHGSGDDFHINPSEVPDGIEYQWNAVEIYGSESAVRSVSLEMHANGWRPVPADRHPGRWTPHGHTGAIVVKGQRLEERPKVLSDEARADDIRAAYQLINDRNQSLQRVKRELPAGFAPSQGRTNITMDSSLSGMVPQQSYQPPED